VLWSGKRPRGNCSVFWPRTAVTSTREAIQMFQEESCNTTKNRSGDHCFRRRCDDDVQSGPMTIGERSRKSRCVSAAHAWAVPLIDQPNDLSNRPTFSTTRISRQKSHMPLQGCLRRNVCFYVRSRENLRDDAAAGGRIPGCREYYA
jgi:hypothetical protein